MTMLWLAEGVAPDHSSHTMIPLVAAHTLQEQGQSLST
jgi:hypothetical protein